jgi:hypothetical protein
VLCVLSTLFYWCRLSVPGRRTSLDGRILVSEYMLVDGAFLWLGRLYCRNKLPSSSIVLQTNIKTYSLVFPGTSSYQKCHIGCHPPQYWFCRVGPMLAEATNTSVDSSPPFTIVRCREFYRVLYSSRGFRSSVLVSRVLVPRVMDNAEYTGFS